MVEQIIKNVFTEQIHPFDKLLNDGNASKHQIQMWLVNRFYFEKTMINKDAIVLFKCCDQEFRKIWIKRIIDADSVGGGLDSWVKMGIACGVDVTDTSKLYPAVKQTLDKFIEWCLGANWKLIVTSSLSQLQATLNHKNKYSTWPELYPWIEPGGLEYFSLRTSQANVDSLKCLEFINEWNIPVEQIEYTAKLKRNVMLALLDAVYLNT
jgi:pyrroloquinoline-quinone synthase